MSKHQQHLLCLHGIIRRSASHQMMFAFVRGVLSCNREATIQDALRMFETEFQIEDFSIRSETALYYTMLHEYMDQNNVFYDKIKRNKPGRQERPLHKATVGNPG